MCCRYDDLALFFWQEGGNSIPSALFASVLLSRLAHTSAIAVHSYFKEVVRHMEELSARFETLAVGVLDHCYAEDTAKAQAILRVSLHHISLSTVSKHYRNSLALAVHGKLLRFVAHPACLAQIDREWYGVVSPQSPLYVLAFNALTFGLPILLDISLSTKAHFWSVRFRGNNVGSAVSMWDSVGYTEEEVEIEDEEELEKDLITTSEVTRKWVFATWFRLNRTFYASPVCLCAPLAVGVRLSH
jgi:hypothetical protein